MTAPNDLCHDFASLAASTRYEDIAPAGIDAAKKSVLDTVGVIVAASGMEPATRRVADLVRESEGKPESTILGFGGRASASMAAFANGCMAHCLDFDDRTPWGAHAGSSIVPAVFALAERHGGVSGERMIAAVAVGQDVFARLRFGVDWRQDWNLSSVMGVFSACAGAAHTVGMNRDQAAHALGLASMQSSGTMEVIYATGSDLRGLYAGFTARGAVFAVQMAEKGFTGVDTLFEGKAGIFNTYFQGRYDRAAIVENLGVKYMGDTTLYKPWPVVGVAHTYIHVTIELMKQHGLVASDIDEIRAYVGDYHQRMCTPLETRRSPTTAVDAKFSLPFCLAIAATKGDVGIADFALPALQDASVLAMAQRVVPVEDSSRNWTSVPPDARVEIVTRDGRKIEGIGRDVPGSPRAPMTWDDITRKFRNCASAGAVPIGADQVDRACHMARNLEELDDATELLRVLA